MAARRVAWMLAPALVMAFPAAAGAATTAELEARIAALEAALADVKNELAATRAATAPAQLPTPAPAPAPMPAPPPMAAAAPHAAPAAPAPEKGFRMGEATTVSMGGFVKLTANTSRYSGGAVGPNAAMRDFYIPGAVPVGGPTEGWDTHLSAKESRLWIGAETKVGGDTVTGKVELDFLLDTNSGDERTTNSWQPRLRVAWFEWNGLRFGQDFSTFQNTGALPEMSDFIGPAEGTVFVRQPQIRYTRGPFQIAIENRTTTLTPFGGGARIQTDNGAMPDVVARWNWQGEWGQASIAGLYRRLRVDTGGVGAGHRGEADAYGISAAAKIRLGDDDLRLNVVAGDGIGRYVGLNAINDGVLTAAANGRIESIPLVAGYAAYRHVWSPQWRSTLALGGLWASNPAIGGPLQTRRITSLHANLLMSPVPQVTLGGELILAERELENGTDGSLTRLQFSAKYEF